MSPSTVAFSKILIIGGVFKEGRMYRNIDEGIVMGRRINLEE